MNYLMVNDNIYLSDGQTVQKLKNTDLPQIEFGSTEGVCICVVDVDVELASAPEAKEEKKDSMLARKFAKLHPGDEYILQDEKIDENIFQVMGVKAQKIKEIYSLVPDSSVSVFVPYAVAIRQFLMDQNIDLGKGVVFLDDLEQERLMTVFSGRKFSVTRTLTSNEMEGLLPEIKRSQIGFSKKIEEFDGGSMDKDNLLTNSRYILEDFLKYGQNIEYIDVKYPAIEGLKAIKNLPYNIKFLLPEEIKNRKKRNELKHRTIGLVISLFILATGLGFSLINKIKLAWADGEYARLRQQNQILEEKLSVLDINTYREDLNQQKFMNFAIPYLKLLNILPLSYEVYSFRYFPTDHWKLEAYILSKDGEAFDEIPKFDILKNAFVSDYFIKNRPGKRIQIDL